MISVAMATYNGERYIRQQLDSILNQNVQDFEIVVCDDCSTDGTWKANSSRSPTRTTSGKKTT